MTEMVDKLQQIEWLKPYQQFPSNHGNKDIQYPTSCNGQALPQESSPDQATNNSKFVPQSNIPTSVQENLLDSDIDSLPYDEFEKLVETLNEQTQPGWKRLAGAFKVTRGKVKEFEKSENPAEELLDYLNEEKKLTIREPKYYLQSAGLDSAIKCIHCEDLLEDGNQGPQIEENCAASWNRDDRSHSTMSADNQQDQNNTGSDENGSVSVSASSDRHSSSSLNIHANRNCCVSSNTSSDRSSGSTNTNNIPFEPETQNSLENNVTPEENDVFNNLDRQHQKKDAPDKNVNTDKQPAATKSDSVATENTETIQEAGSGKSTGNDATPSEDPLQSYTSQASTTSAVNNKLNGEPQTTDSSDVKRNNTQSEQPTTQTPQSANSDLEAFNSKTEQAESIVSQHESTSSLLEDGDPNSQNESLEQEKSSSLDNDVKLDSSEYGIQATSIGINTDNPNIPGPLTCVLSGNSDEKQDEKVPLESPSGNISKDKIKEKSTDEEAADDQADSIVSQHESTSSLLEDGEPNSQNESLEQKMSSSLDNDVKPDSSEYWIQATSIGINTENPNIPGPLTCVLSGNSDVKQDEKVPLESPSGNISKDKVKEKSTDMETADDQVGISVTSLDGRTDNPYIPEPLTKAMSDNDKESKNKTSSVGPNGEANADKKNASSLGGTTEKHKMPEGISGTEDEETQTKTTTGQQQRPETDPSNKHYERNLTLEASEQPSIRSYRDIQNSISGGTQSLEQTRSTVVSNLSAVELRNQSLASSSGSLSTEQPSSVYRDLQNSIPSRPQSMEPGSTSGAMSSLSAIELRPTESLSLTSSCSKPEEVSYKTESAECSRSLETLPKELDC